jgi:hypothetical protein
MLLDLLREMVRRECQQELLAWQAHYAIPLEPFFSTVGPLTRPIFMGDNEARPPTIRMLVNEHHENHFGNVRDFVSEG